MPFHKKYNRDSSKFDSWESYTVAHPLSAINNTYTSQLQCAQCSASNQRATKQLSDTHITMSIADSLQLEYDDALVEEDVALLTENINAIQSELFARQMLKEKLEKKLSAETQKIKIESGYYRDQENNTEENDDTEELLYQPEELNTLTKQMLAAYLENRGDELKELLKEASGEATNGLSLHHDEHVFVALSQCDELKQSKSCLQWPESAQLPQPSDSLLNLPVKG